MKLKSFFGATSACLLASSLAVSPNVFADTNEQQTLQQLQQEVNALSQEISALKQQQQSQSKQIKHNTYAVAHPRPMPPQSSAVVHPAPIPKLQGERLTQGITVTTSPYLGLRSAFDASDLVTNLPTMNEDLRLLQQREKIETTYKQLGLPDEFSMDRALVELSGGLEGQFIYQHPYEGASTTDIDLTKGEFDTLAYASPWALGLLSMRYDNSPLPNVTTGGQVQGAGQRFANSRIYLRRGFVTIGDIHRLPIYFSLGQMYAPFGVYSSELLTTPQPQAIGQTNERQALLGFYDDGLYIEGYTYKGDSHVASPGINSGGGNIGYKYDGNRASFNLGFGAMANVADSLGMQSTGAPSNTFQGFGFSSATEQLCHRVPALNAHGELDVGKFTFLGELVSATRQFDSNNLSFNSRGADPQGLQLEADYTYRMFNWPSVFTLEYGQSWQSLALSIPSQSYVAEINTSIWKDTIEAIEFRHDKNYPGSDIASGNGFPVPVNSMGGSQNTVTVQVGAYF